MTKKNLQQHRNLVKVQSADALRSATDDLKSQGYFPAPMPNDFGHRSNSSGSEFGLWEDRSQELRAPVNNMPQFT